MSKINPPPNQKLDWNKWIEIPIKEPKDTGKCRYCNHYFWNHIRHYVNGKSPCSYNNESLAKVYSPNKIELLIPRKDQITKCPCMEYIPGDNIAYLEWKAKKEGAI